MTGLVGTCFFILRNSFPASPAFITRSAVSAEIVRGEGGVGWGRVALVGVGVASGLAERPATTLH